MRTVFALFADPAEAQRAVQDLIESGLPHENISLAAGRDTEAGIKHREASALIRDTEKGALIGGLSGLLLGLTEVAIPGGIVIAGGWLAAAILGAGVGAAAGGLIGSLVDLGMAHEEASHFAEGVRRGDTLVTIKTEDNALASVIEIVNRHHASKVHESAGP